MKTSKILNGWANAYIVLAIFFIVLGIIGAMNDSAWSFDVFHFGILFIFISPLVRGLSVLVANAEEAMDHRFDVKLKNCENEE